MANQADTPATIAQRRSLERHRRFATGLLIAMAAIYVATLWSGQAGFWADLVLAGSEAALVGGLADWFAVTALLRRPLGLPIPHTAVIPSNKDRIGVGLGSFIERHFLEPELVAARLRSAGVSRRLGAWLSDRRNADLVADRLMVILGFVFRALDDEKLRRLMQVMLRRRLRETELAPILSALLAILRQNGAHQQLFDHVLKAIGRYVYTNRFRIFAMVEERSTWWVPRQVDRRVARAIIDGLIGYIGDLENRNHEARRSFDAAIDGLIADLKDAPDYRAQIDALRDRILDTPEVGRYFDALWHGVRGVIEHQLAQPRSGLHQAVSGALRAIGTAVAEDAAVQARMDARIEDVVQTLVVPWRKEIGGFVADVVCGWETRTIVDRVELAVGRDLQYIRVNGTLVGAVVGCLIFLVSGVL